MMNSMMGIIFLFGVVTASNYSYPRILILGPTGVGKSSLGNVLAGCEPSDEDCFFPICNGIDSCTKETTIAEATFLGQLAGETTAILDGNVTLIDSPGFGDTDLEQPTLIAEMIDVLKNNLQEANTILLCFEKGRWNDGILKMIEELESLFGRDRLWTNVILEITKWSYNPFAIADRERQGITEAGTLAEINKKLQENFHLNHSLPGVFIDSYAVYYLDTDEVQKQYFFNYSLTLWEAANAMEPFTFYTIEDILNQLHTCQIENDCLNEVLEERITRIENNVDNINSTVANNAVSIQTNKKTIDTLTETTSRFVSYCGYRRETTSTGTLTYSRLITSINSFSTGGLDIATGVFTAPTPGTYLVNFNFMTHDAGYFDVYINKNGHDLIEGLSSSGSVDDDDDMTGRTLTLQLGTNDKLYLHVTLNPAFIYFPTFCITLIK